MWDPWSESSRPGSLARRWNDDTKKQTGRNIFNAKCDSVSTEVKSEIKHRRK